MMRFQLCTSASPSVVLFALGSIHALWIWNWLNMLLPPLVFANLLTMSCRYTCTVGKLPILKKLNYWLLTARKRYWPLIWSILVYWSANFLNFIRGLYLVQVITLHTWHNTSSLNKATVFSQTSDLGVCCSRRPEWFHIGSRIMVDILSRSSCVNNLLSPSNSFVQLSSIEVLVVGHVIQILS